MMINVTLRLIKQNPAQAAILKVVEDPNLWKIFSDNLKEHQWLPFEGDMCDTCGRMQTSTTSIAAAILPTGDLDIICNRCYTNQLKNVTSQTGDKDATS